MSDRIGVMNEGSLLQVGLPQQIYEHPTSRFVADFIGEINLLSAVVVDQHTVRLNSSHLVAASPGAPVGADVTVAIRPERIELYDLDEPIPDRMNRIEGTVMRRIYHGDVFYYDIDTPAGLIEVKEENRPGVELYDLGEATIVVWAPEATSVVQD